MAYSRIKTGVALLLLTVCGSIGSAAFADGDEGDKCDCFRPNTNKYGILNGKGECPVVDCWIKVEENN